MGFLPFEALKKTATLKTVVTNIEQSRLAAVTARSGSGIDSVKCDQCHTHTYRYIVPIKKGEKYPFIKKKIFSPLFQF